MAWRKCVSRIVLPQRTESVQLILCDLCHERPLVRPVMRDHLSWRDDFCWAEGVVSQDRFYCSLHHSKFKKINLGRHKIKACKDTSYCTFHQSIIHLQCFPTFSLQLCNNFLIFFGFGPIVRFKVFNLAILSVQYLQIMHRCAPHSVRPVVI